MIAEVSDETNAAFGARLRALRTAAEMTQAALAEAVGLTANSLARLERGERHPSWDTVVRLAKALGVEPNDFLSD